MRTNEAIHIALEPRWSTENVLFQSIIHTIVLSTAKDKIMIIVDSNDKLFFKGETISFDASLTYVTGSSQTPMFNWICPFNCNGDQNLKVENFVGENEKQYKL